MQPTTYEVISDVDNDIVEEVVIDTGNSGQHPVKWDIDFVGVIYIDAGW